MDDFGSLSQERFDCEKWPSGSLSSISSASSLQMRAENLTRDSRPSVQQHPGPKKRLNKSLDCRKQFTQDYNQLLSKSLPQSRSRSFQNNSYPRCWVNPEKDIPSKSYLGNRYETSNVKDDNKWDYDWNNCSEATPTPEKAYQPLEITEPWDSTLGPGWNFSFMNNMTPENFFDYQNTSGVNIYAHNMNAIPISPSDYPDAKHPFGSEVRRRRRTQNECANVINQSNRLPQTPQNNRSNRVPQSPQINRSNRLSQSQRSNQWKRLFQSPQINQSNRLPQTPQNQWSRLPQTPLNNRSNSVPPNPQDQDWNSFQGNCPPLTSTPMLSKQCRVKIRSEQDSERQKCDEDQLVQELIKSPTDAFDKIMSFVTSIGAVDEEDISSIANFDDCDGKSFPWQEGDNFLAFVKEKHLAQSIEYCKAATGLIVQQHVADNEEQNEEDDDDIQ